MPVLVDFALTQLEDFTLNVGMVPAVPIGGWTLQFWAATRLGAVSGLIIKSAASGYGGGASGITINNSGNGTFSVQLNSVDTSGLSPGSYSYEINRTDSGYYTAISQGYLVLLPGNAVWPTITSG